MIRIQKSTKGEDERMQYSEDRAVALFQSRLTLIQAVLDWYDAAPLYLMGAIFLVGTVTLHPEDIGGWAIVVAVSAASLYLSLLFYGRESGKVLDWLARETTNYAYARIALFECFRDPDFRDNFRPWRRELEERLPFRLEG